jgi:hypothetical protein
MYKLVSYIDGVRKLWGGIHSFLALGRSRYAFSQFMLLFLCIRRSSIEDCQSDSASHRASTCEPYRSRSANKRVIRCRLDIRLDGVEYGDPKRGTDDESRVEDPCDRSC